MHSVCSEPYYYESAYDFDFELGVMVASGKNGGTWKCTSKCKAIKQFEVDSYLNLSKLHQALTFLFSHCQSCSQYSILACKMEVM